MLLGEGEKRLFKVDRQVVPDRAGSSHILSHLEVRYSIGNTGENLLRLLKQRPQPIAALAQSLSRIRQTLRLCLRNARIHSLQKGLFQIARDLLPERHELRVVSGLSEGGEVAVEDLRERFCALGIQVCAEISLELRIAGQRH